MKRYLLFDSGCCQCSKLAKAIEQEADGKLTIRSLRDPAVKELLDRERPGWKWEPMLVEEKGDTVRLYAGGAMERRLLVALGPRRALRIMELMNGNRELKFLSSPNKDRRNFLRLAGATAIGVVTLMLPGVTQASGSAHQDAGFNRSDKFAFVPLRDERRVDKYIEKIEHASEFKKISHSVAEDRATWGAYEVVSVYDRDNANKLVGDVVYKPFVLQDGGRGAILGMITEEITFVTAIALDHASFDSNKMTVGERTSRINSRIWMLNPNSGDVQILKSLRQVVIPTTEPNKLPSDDHTWCVHFCGVMCAVGTAFLCGFICPVTTGPATPICWAVCAAFGYAYCANCDWYCRMNGF